MTILYFISDLIACFVILIYSSKITVEFFVQHKTTCKTRTGLQSPNTNIDHKTTTKDG